MSIATVSVAPVAPMLPTSVGVAPAVTVTEPVPSKPSVAVNVAVQVMSPSLAASCRQRAAHNRHVGVGEAGHRLAEGERHQRAVVAVVQRRVDDVDRHRRVRVSIATVSVAPAAPVLPTSVGVAPGRPSPSRRREAVVGRERRRRSVMSSELVSVPSVPPKTVMSAVGEARHRLAEGERHQRAVVAVVQRASTMSTVTVGFSVSIATVSAPPAPVLPAASV